MRKQLLVIAAILTSCASLRPLSVPTSSAQAPDRDDGLQLSAREGRPNGVLLRLQAADAPADCEKLALYRLEQGAEQAELLHELVLDESLRDGLIRGIEVVDQGVRPGAVFTYQLFGLDERDEVRRRSAALDVNWREPPDAPQEVTASAPFVDAVELQWKSPSDAGAVIFRRNVLEEGSGFRRVAELQRGARSWVDRDVRPAGVWSYRVASSQTNDVGMVQYGPPSEEVYASTPDGGQDDSPR